MGNGSISCRKDDALETRNIVDEPIGRVMVVRALMHDDVHAVDLDVSAAKEMIRSD